MVEALVAPRLRIARLRLAGVLGEKYMGAEPRLALPYPAELEGTLNLYARGLASWVDVKLKVQEVFGDFYRSWLWIEEPLIRYLPLLGARVKCYGSSASETTKRGGELALLAFKARARGEVDLEEWRRVLGEARAPELSGFDAAVLPGKTGSPGEVDVWPYPYPPSETLDPSRLTREAVMEYVDYVFNYIVKYRSVDEAYVRWLEERRGLRDPELLALLSMAGQSR